MRTVARRLGGAEKLRVGQVVRISSQRGWYTVHKVERVDRRSGTRGVWLSEEDSFFGGLVTNRHLFGIGDATTFFVRERVK